VQPDGETGGRLRVLIVEDHEETREMFAWCLRAAGWMVDAVGDGMAAVLVAASLEPDVIVMDLCLPVLDGIETARRLKSYGSTSHVPIVACTGDPSMTEPLARAAGCDMFIAKPIEPERLRAVLESLVADGVASTG
jgi:CheY-like chemotaxis protein